VVEQVIGCNGKNNLYDKLLVNIARRWYLDQYQVLVFLPDKCMEGDSVALNHFPVSGPNGTP
jgi:hypothetical protein